MAHQEREPKTQDVTRMFEQSVHALRELDQRLVGIQGELSTLMARASGLSRAAPYAGLENVASPGLAASLGSPLGAAGTATIGAAPPRWFSSTRTTDVGPVGFAGEGIQAVSTRDLLARPPAPIVPTTFLVDAGKEFQVQVELPGVTKENLELTLSEAGVSIRAESKPDLQDGVLLLNERGPAVYRRMIPLPSETDAAKAKASLKDGVLALRIPKKVPTEGLRKLDVAYG